MGPQIYLWAESKDKVEKMSTNENNRSRVSTTEFLQAIGQVYESRFMGALSQSAAVAEKYNTPNDVIILGARKVAARLALHEFINAASDRQGVPPNHVSNIIERDDKLKGERLVGLGLDALKARYGEDCNLIVKAFSPLINTEMDVCDPHARSKQFLELKKKVFTAATSAVNYNDEKKALATEIVGEIVAFRAELGAAVDKGRMSPGDAKEVDSAMRETISGGFGTKMRQYVEEKIIGEAVRVHRAVEMDSIIKSYDRYVVPDSPEQDKKHGRNNDSVSIGIGG